MTEGFAGTLEFIQHDCDALAFISAGDYVMVEGTSHGKMSGNVWTGGVTPGGRFCNVFIRARIPGPLEADFWLLLQSSTCKFWRHRDCARLDFN